MDDRTAERFKLEIAGRPDLMGGRTSMRLDAKVGRLNEAASPNVKNKSHSITAEVIIPDGGADGAIEGEIVAILGRSKRKLISIMNPNLASFIGSQNIYLSSMEGTNKGCSLRIFIHV